MKTVILCGGLGTRLREETEFRPKPMVEIGGRPVLWHIMKIYAHSGFREFVLCLGYRGNLIKEYFLNYEAMNNDFTICLGRQHDVTYLGAHAEQDFNVTLVDTGADSMTGGRVKRTERYMDGDINRAGQRRQTAGGAVSTYAAIAKGCSSGPICGATISVWRPHRAHWSSVSPASSGTASFLPSKRINCSACGQSRRKRGASDWR